ncbi:MAG: hypothetical protein D4R98_02165 [Comamonadaceae bacterium]|nr:MAG: hypothetical protein D4R98_02165 [Comamonadaceae bacterium]
MTTLHITRPHNLSLDKARAFAQQWALEAERDFGMETSLVMGTDNHQTAERWNFKRTGVTGSLVTSAQSFELELHLGFLLGAFQNKIKQQIEQNLDQLLGPAKG